MPVFAIGMPSPLELGIILVLCMMLFGVGKLPMVFSELGKGVKALREATDDDTFDV